MVISNIIVLAGVCTPMQLHSDTAAVCRVQFCVKVCVWLSVWTWISFLRKDYSVQELTLTWTNLETNALTYLKSFHNLLCKQWSEKTLFSHWHGPIIAETVYIHYCLLGAPEMDLLQWNLSVCDMQLNNFSKTCRFVSYSFLCWPQ